MGNLANISKDSFESEVLKSSTPVVVDFWAEWCGPCKALAPVLEEISSEVGENAKVVKVNVDEAGELAQQYGIRGIPTMLLFSGGELKATKVGATTKSNIISWIKENT